MTINYPHKALASFELLFNREKSVFMKDLVDNTTKTKPIIIMITNDNSGVTIKPLISIARPSFTSSAADKSVFSSTIIRKNAVAYVFGLI